MPLKKFPIVEPNWTDNDAAALRDFFNTPIGQHFLSRLYWQRPAVTERKDSEQRRIQQDEQSGYEACIADMSALAAFGAQPPAQS